MNFLHKDLALSKDDVVEVILDHAANVQLMDDPNYTHYRAGRQYKYFGGYVTQSPFRLSAPFPGRWHLVVDLGGNVGTVRATARVLSGVAV